MINSCGGKGLFSAEGDIWKKERKLYGSPLNKSHIRDYVVVAKLVASRLVEKWENTMMKAGVVTINSDLNCFTTDVTSLVGFTTDIDTLRKGDHEIGRLTQPLMRGILFRVLFPIPYWKIPIVGQYLDGVGWLVNHMARIVQQIVEEHKSVLAQYESVAHLQQEDEDFVKRSKRFLGKVLIQSERDNSTLSQDRLVGNLLTLFIAGIDSSSNTLSSCLYIIAADETGLQDELAAEIMAFSELEKEDSLDDLNNRLPRLRSLMYEVLRV